MGTHKNSTKMQRLTLMATAVAAAKAITIQGEGGDSCWVQAELPLDCPEGTVDGGLACFEPAEDDYVCYGEFCVQEECPSGYTDFGDFIDPLDIGISDFQMACIDESPSIPYLASIKRWTWRGIKYHNCRSGYHRKPRHGWCLPD